MTTWDEIRKRFSSYYIFTPGDPATFIKHVLSSNEDEAVETFTRIHGKTEATLLNRIGVVVKSFSGLEKGSTLFNDVIIPAIPNMKPMEQIEWVWRQFNNVPLYTNDFL